MTVAERSDAENIFAKVKQQVTTRRGGIDLAHVDASWIVRGTKDNLWAPVDYGVVPRQNLYPDAVDRYGVGILYWSFNIVYNTTVFRDRHPTTWAQVWDYARAHPGRVALWGARPNYTLEAALMADGVPPDQIYPLDPTKIARAYRSLDSIKKDVRWFQSGSDGGKLFTDGSVDVGMFYGGIDVWGLVDKGAPLDVEWNQGIYTRDYWVVPRNAPHAAAAMRLLAWAVQPTQQARFAQASYYGYVSPGAQSLVTDQAKLRRLCSYQPNKAKQIEYDFHWWGEHDDAMISQWNAWIQS